MLCLSCYTFTARNEPAGKYTFFMTWCAGDASSLARLYARRRIFSYGHCTLSLLARVLSLAGLRLPSRPSHCPILYRRLISAPKVCCLWQCRAATRCPFTASAALRIALRLISQPELSPSAILTMQVSRGAHLLSDEYAILAPTSPTACQTLPRGETCAPNCTTDRFTAM